MRVTVTKLVSALKKVAVVREQLDVLCVGKQEPALRVMDLHHVVGEIYGLKIEMLKVDFAADHLKGKVERYNDGRARVLVRADLSEPEQRIVAIKELCHLLLDEEDDWSADGPSTLDALLAESVEMLATGQGVSNPSSPLHSELMAMLAATELAYPPEYRESDRQKIADNEATTSSIALEHDVPAYVIEHAFRHEALLNSARNPEAITALAAE